MNDSHNSSSSDTSTQDDEDGQAYDERRGPSPADFDHDKKDVTADIATSYAKMATRPEAGRDGTPIELLFNFFKLRLDPLSEESDDLATIYHYNVNMENTGAAPGQPSTPPIPLLAKIWDSATNFNTNPALRTFFETAAFDGMKNTYSPVRLEKDGIKLALKDGSLELKVGLEMVAIIEMNDLFDYTHKSLAGNSSLPAGPKAQAGIQAFDVLLRSVLSKNPIYTISAAQGQEHYEERQSQDIGRGGEVFQGHFASVRPTEGGTFVNIDTIYSPFVREGPLIEVCSRLLGAQVSMDSHQLTSLTRVLRGAGVRKTYGPAGQRFWIKGFVGRRAVDFKFEDKDGAAQNLQTYFSRVYNINLSYPELPLVELEDKQMLMPLELIVLEPGAPIPFARISPEQTAAMSEISDEEPQQRREDIDRQMGMAGYQSSMQVQAWGVFISGLMEKVDARVLEAPTIKYHASSRPPPAVKGVLTPNKDLKSWAVVNFDRRYSDQAAAGFIRRLVDSCRRMGMIITYVPQVRRGGRNLETSLRDAGKAAYQDTGIIPQLTVAITPDRGAYEGLKYTALFKLPSPVPTQILLSSKLSRDGKIDSYIANVALKLNVKLCGQNWTLAANDLPSIDADTLLLGVDVSHHRDVGSNQPSISALVASTDGTHASFQAEVRLHTPQVEIIEDFAEMFRELLHKYQQRTGRSVKSVIMFRDGLSEGEYARANEKEVAAIKNVCLVEGAPDVKVTFVICTKSHRVQAFAASQGDEDQSGNLPPGTVIDSRVVHPHLFDFYLVSHSGLVGTAKPTHYIVIRNDHNFSSDAIQKLCYSLSFTFAGATRSVSVPSPSCYAHIVAQRCRALFDHEEGSNTEVSSGSGGHPPVVFDKYRIKNALEKKNGMPGI